eukprot:gb/GEZN01027655.1/.p2 GENE.gb/GEZN01027655.1/~~gb/GEZN01027655.1/.p2  ORF type:complete len:108 (+),score=9.65 gb/GEZN01027655.1/:113-436(+)
MQPDQPRQQPEATLSLCEALDDSFRQVQSGGYKFDRIKEIFFPQGLQPDTQIQEDVPTSSIYPETAPHPNPSIQQNTDYQRQPEQIQVLQRQRLHQLQSQSNPWVGR